MFQPRTTSNPQIALRVQRWGETPASGFDASLMAAMNWPPQTIVTQWQVVASGMTPPDQLPT